MKVGVPASWDAEAGNPMHHEGREVSTKIVFSGLPSCNFAPRVVKVVRLPRHPAFFLPASFLQRCDTIKPPTMKLLSCLLAVCLLSSPVLLFAQALVPKPVPKPIENLAEKAADYSQEGYVGEKFRTVYRFENDGTGTREIYARIKIQSEAGVEQWGQVVVGYNSANERVEIPYVRVLRADGTTMTAPPDSVQDLSIPVEREAPVYTDYRQKHITVPGLRPGEVLEYDVVTVTHTPLAQNQFWMEHDFIKNGIVLDEELAINVPTGRDVKLKTRPGMEPKITDENGRRIYQWTSSHRERDDDEKDDKKKKQKAEPDPPAVQLTTFSSWEEMGRWYAELSRERWEPTADIRSKAAELTAGKNGDLDKIAALYDYVATNFRYISLSFGVGRLQPHAATDVLHNQYGDCKDKHTLLASLLLASGFHPSTVLINSARKLDPDVPSPAQFDHVISLVPLGKDEIWMDTTTEVAPFRMLISSIRKKRALVIPQQGAPHLEETPADPPIPNRQFQQLEGKVNEFGKLDAHVKIAARGDTELFMRIWFRRVPSSKWDQLVKQLDVASGLSGEISNLKVGDPAATKEAFQFEYDIAAPNFFDWARRKSQLTLPFSQISLVDADADDAAAEPIQLGSPGEYVYHVRLDFPAKYTERAPLAFSMKRDYAQYSASYKVDGNTFTADRNLVWTQRELPASRAGDYLSFRRAVTADTQQSLSVDGMAAGNPATSADLKGDDLNDAANAALDRGDYQVAIGLFKRVVETDPKHKTAWTNMGRAYMGLRQTDDAIGAFRKQAELNEYDESAYNNLAWAYSTERKYDQAAEAYGKALEINPLSDYAHAALGSMYSEAQQYDKAAPELEKAVSLKPDNPLLEVNLGNAYLNLGQDEKAIAAYDRAVEISASPEIWNDIAYQLSLKHAHLDRAQQYAESAVAAVSASLRNVTLQQLSVRNLGLVPGLAAYWDTLGWVYFAKGDLERAEKYVSAAWQLSPHGEVGDHMGQILEKRGQKDEAIRAYAMANSGLRPTPETKSHLAVLAGGESKVDGINRKYRDELQSQRTVTLGKVAKETATADFFVMLSKAASGAAVEGVKFVSGSENLKLFAEALRNANYSFEFPDDTPTKIFRRGTLSCSKTTGECNFVMMIPEDVGSVD
jgi:tetratricopeptide (TPR) repeat protein